MNGVSGLFRISDSLYDGALPAIEALIADDAQPYQVYSPDSKREMAGAPIARDIDHTHYEDENIDKLWVKSQKLVGVTVTRCLKQIAQLTEDLRQRRLQRVPTRPC